MRLDGAHDLRQVLFPLISHHQHEYQHQLEFAHDGSNTAAAAAAGSSTPAAGGGRRVRGGDTGGRAINPVNGTGSRGRKVAVAADRRRAERTLRKEVGVGQDPLDVHGDGAREAQRTRWVMQKQQEIEQQQQQQQRPRTANSAARGTERGGLSNTVACSGTSGLSPSSSDSVQPVLSPSRTISHASSPSSFRLCHLASGSASDSALPQAGRRSSSTAGRKRVSSGWCRRFGVLLLVIERLQCRG